jgi:hypothetical protein
LPLVFCAFVRSVRRRPSGSTVQMSSVPEPFETKAIRYAGWRGPVLGGIAGVGGCDATALPATLDPDARGAPDGVGMVAVLAGDGAGIVAVGVGATASGVRIPPAADVRTAVGDGGFVGTAETAGVPRSLPGPEQATRSAAKTKMGKKMRRGPTTQLRRILANNRSPSVLATHYQPLVIGRQALAGLEDYPAPGAHCAGS